MSAMLTVSGWIARPPTLDQAAEALGVATSSLDPKFGVIPLDPGAGDYVVRSHDPTLAGHPFVYADTPIAPFGPVRAGKPSSLEPGAAVAVGGNAGDPA